MPAVAFLSPHSHHRMMDEAITIRQSCENDVHDLGLVGFGASCDSDNTTTIDIPWLSLAQYSQLSPAYCFENVTGDEGHATINNVLPTHDVDRVSKLSTNHIEAPSPSPGQSTNQSINGTDPQSPLTMASAHRSPDMKVVSNHNKNLDTASEASTLTSTHKSPRRTASIPSAISMQEESELPDIVQHRERNRVAARKCRQKAKSNIAGLQRRERGLSQQNKILLGCVNSLREEVLDLKTEILRHSDCKSGIIQNYIANAARLQMN
ncbi:hypothetical protein F4808DRAFT_393787 [Astrocystis sublimbata]|nr:hypothetical protein F4808DRAFT_393787 [Astrocystis sublimbata]